VPRARPGQQGKSNLTGIGWKGPILGRRGGKSSGRRKRWRQQAKAALPAKGGANPSATVDLFKQNQIARLGGEKTTAETKEEESFQRNRVTAQARGGVHRENIARRGWTLVPGCPTKRNQTARRGGRVEPYEGTGRKGHRGCHCGSQTNGNGPCGSKGRGGICLPRTAAKNEEKEVGQYSRTRGAPFHRPYG